MLYQIIGGVFGAGYAIYRYMQFRKTNAVIQEKFKDHELEGTISYGFPSALFNAVMAGLSFSLVIASVESPSLQALYLAVGGMFIGNVFDAYQLKRVVFTKTSFYMLGTNVRYKSIDKMTQKKRSKKWMIETNQKQTFIVPKAVIDKIQEYTQKKK